MQYYWLETERPYVGKKEFNLNVSLSIVWVPELESMGDGIQVMAWISCNASARTRLDEVNRMRDMVSAYVLIGMRGTNLQSCASKRGLQRC